MTREEAINEIKSWAIPSKNGREVLETLIPELKESEDERIRKELKEAFAAYDIESKWNGIPIRSIFAWLEKQTKSERVIKAARRVLNNWLDDTGYSDVSGDFTELEYAIREYDGEEKHIEQEPVPISCGHENGFMSKEWSEEDERMLRTIISDGSRGVELDSRQIAWLKSLRPSWKPSEEQMDRLSSIVAALRKDCCDDMADFLASIYHNLKN